ncbi:MAG TPA: 50S ribosomal protein L30 [Armatimonadota bacterium]|jgi:large subunit ribosomal protein L30
MPKLRVTLTRSPIGYEKSQRATAEALGLRKLQHSNILPDSQAVRGAVRKIRHLVVVEEVED